MVSADTNYRTEIPGVHITIIMSNYPNVNTPVASLSIGKKRNVCFTLLATVDELAGMDALSCDEEFCPLLEAVWVTEGHFGQGSTTARVVDYVLQGYIRIHQKNESQCP